MLADSIEATVKSLQKPTPKGIEATVAGTTIKKVEGGQFNECELKMREIHLVGDEIRDAVIGFFGPRIQYPS
jgi:membrane-associated HD superfamily phosphohydrolase